MSHSLPSGQYYIRNEETFAGRNRIEDRSLHPKRVYCPTDGDQDLWELLQLPNGRYIVSARGAPTGEIDKLLFAFLIEEKPEEWVITFRRLDDKNRALYTIEKADGTAGWVRENDFEPRQIAVRPLTPTKSIPPQYPPDQLWNIQPLVD